MNVAAWKQIILFVVSVAAVLTVILTGHGGDQGMDLLKTILGGAGGAALANALQSSGGNLATTENVQEK